MQTHHKFTLAPLNRYVPDAQSHHTSNGRHNRLVPAYSRKDEELTVREDHQGLSRATVEDCLRVADNPRSRCHPVGKLLSHKETVEGDNCTWFVFLLNDVGPQKGSACR